MCLSLGEGTLLILAVQGLRVQSSGVSDFRALRDALAFLGSGFELSFSAFASKAWGLEPMDSGLRFQGEGMGLIFSKSCVTSKA